MGGCNCGGPEQAAPTGLFCFDQGSGEPLVLLHGNGGECTFFQKQVGFFGDSRRILAPDTRGHGRSERGEGEFTLARFAEDLKDHLDAKGVDRADLLGFDDGGATALIFALRYPERVRRLVLVGTVLDPQGRPWYLQLSNKIGWLANKGAGGLDGEAADHSLELLKLQMEPSGLTPEQLKAIKAPTLVIAGKRDQVRRAHTKLIADSIPGAKLAILPGDHYMLRHEPKIFNKTVAEFFDQTE